MHRSDDNPEALKKRLESYHKQTKPLVDYYGKKDLHRHVEASLPPKKVFEEIINIFDSLKSKDKVFIARSK